MKLRCCKDDVGFMVGTIASTWSESIGMARNDSGFLLSELGEAGVSCVRVNIKEVQNESV